MFCVDFNCNVFTVTINTIYLRIVKKKKKTGSETGGGEIGGGGVIVISLIILLPDCFIVRICIQNNLLPPKVDRDKINTQKKVIKKLFENLVFFSSM